MEQACADYCIDGWHLPFPQEWSLSWDKKVQPPQLIFEVPGEPVTINVSTWNFRRPETGEVPSAEAVCVLMEQAIVQQGGAAGGLSGLPPSGPCRLHGPERHQRRLRDDLLLSLRGGLRDLRLLHLRPGRGLREVSPLPEAGPS